MNEIYQLNWPEAIVSIVGMILITLSIYIYFYFRD